MIATRRAPKAAMPFSRAPALETTGAGAPSLRSTAATDSSAVL